ncbi:MAG: uracil-DNA glycosylase [Cytophagales bacterium]
MKVKISESWEKVLKDEFDKSYFEDLVNFVRSEYKNYEVYPPGKQIFSAFELCSFENTKVVILGQDPYHGKGQAHGLCFSVNDYIPFPPSLVNIFKELKDDLGVEIPQSGNLEKWAQQGVLLLNATLTVRANEAGSHQGKGWEQFTDFVIQQISKLKSNVVFILWGSYAQKKTSFIDDKKHCILKAVHPSPLSVYRGFYGSKPFSQTNEYLKSTFQQPIIW